jgi:hypothetical protein
MIPKGFERLPGRFPERLPMAPRGFHRFRAKLRLAPGDSQRLAEKQTIGFGFGVLGFGFEGLGFGFGVFRVCVLEFKVWVLGCRLQEVPNDSQRLREAPREVPREAPNGSQRLP